MAGMIGALPSHLHDTAGAGPGLTMHAQSCASHTYLSLPCDEPMGTGGHEITLPTDVHGCTPGTRPSSCAGGSPHVCTCNPGQHGTGWACFVRDLTIGTWPSGPCRYGSTCARAGRGQYVCSSSDATPKILPMLHKSKPSWQGPSNEPAGRRRCTFPKRVFVWCVMRGLLDHPIQAWESSLNSKVQASSHIDGNSK